MGTISVIISAIDDKAPITLDVIEHIPYEPSAYAWDAGWLCADPRGIEYFVSESGIVYADDPEKPHENCSKSVGTAPEILKQSEQMERELDRAHGEEN